MLISETHFTGKSYIRIPWYTDYHTNHPAETARGGTALILKSSNQQHPLNPVFGESSEGEDVSRTAAPFRESAWEFVVSEWFWIDNPCSEDKVRERRGILCPAILPQRNLTVSTYLSQFSQHLPSVHLISFILSQRCNIGALVPASELRLVGPLARLHFGIWSNHWSLQLSLIHSCSLKLSFLNISIITYLVNSVLESKPQIPW
jgi:hypothetical protein